MTRLSFSGMLGICVTALSISGTTAWAEKKVALVIGELTARRGVDIADHAGISSLEGARQAPERTSTTPSGMRAIPGKAGSVRNMAR